MALKKIRRKPEPKSDKATEKSTRKKISGGASGSMRDRSARIRDGGDWLASPTILTLVVFLVSFVLYANTIGYSFVWDDFNIIVKNEAIQTLDAQTIKDAFTEEFIPTPHREGEYFRPLATLSYHVNYKLTGGKPAGFHFANVLTNSLTCSLVFIFMWLLFRNTGVGFACALLFAVHPTHTESVAWVAGRTDVIATFWIVLSLICYVLYRHKSRVALISVSLAAYFFALLSKELAACVPLVVALLEFGPFQGLLTDEKQQRKSAGRRTTNSLVSVALYLVVLVLFLMMRENAIGTLTSGHSPIAPGALGRIALPLSIFAGYVFKVFFPLQLSGEYDAPVPTSFAHPHVIAGAVLLALLLWGIWRFRGRAPLVLGAGIFLFGLAPVLNVIPIGEVSADRFLYFPSLGVALLLGWIFSSALSHQHPALGLPRHDPNYLRISGSFAQSLSVLFLVVLLASTARTVTRNRDWKNNEVFYAKTVAQAPGSPRAHVNSGNLARDKGDIPSAVHAYKTAISLNPDYAEALNNLAGIYARQGRFDDAIPLMERALRTWSDSAELNRNLGSLYLSRQQYDNAERRLSRALAIDPSDMRAHYFLGLLRFQQRDLSSARVHFERAAVGPSELHASFYYLAVIEKESGNHQLAQRYARQFLAGYTNDDDLRKTAQAIASGE